MSEPNRAGRRATITDVALEAGASRTTTSRALSGRGYTSPEVRERVRRAAAKLGYVPDVMARNLKQGTSNTIGLLVTDLANPFYSEVATGASQYARQLGYLMTLADTNADPDAEIEAATALIGQRVAGLVVAPVSRAISDLVRAQHLPMVEVDRSFGMVDAVTVDNIGGAREATEHLLNLGHRDIALIIDEVHWSSGQLRRNGYLEAMVAQHLDPDPALIVTTGWDAEAARRTTRELLSGDHRPTALFAANNVLAEGAWRGIQDVGLRIPDEISLVAFDDLPWMSMVSPAITTVAQDPYELGRVAITQLINRINRPDAPRSSVQLAAGLVVRASTGLAPVPIP